MSREFRNKISGLKDNLLRRNKSMNFISYFKKSLNQFDKLRGGGEYNIQIHYSNLPMTKIFNKAFTLIEIIIVIVVIGVLATALIPRVKGMQEKARLMRLERDYQDLRTAVFVAQSNTKKTLMQITGDTFTSRYCTN